MLVTTGTQPASASTFGMSNAELAEAALLRLLTDATFRTHFVQKGSRVLGMSAVIQEMADQMRKADYAAVTSNAPNTPMLG